MPLQVGRQLMDACEAEACSWGAEACRIGGGSAPAVAAGTSAGVEPGCEHLWLEVTATNTAGRAFYEALGYADFGRTAGGEVQRAAGGGGFSMAQVERVVMRKTLRS
jgi:ribosomal protein S18 acetylase RimI-like enzyme